MTAQRRQPGGLIQYEGATKIDTVPVYCEVWVSSKVCPMSGLGEREKYPFVQISIVHLDLDQKVSNVRIQKVGGSLAGKCIGLYAGFMAST